MYLHVLSSKGEMDTVVEHIHLHKSKSKKIALNAIIKSFRRRYGAFQTKNMFGTKPEWPTSDHRVVKVGKRNKNIF